MEEAQTDEHGVAAVETSGGGTSYRSEDGFSCSKCGRIFTNKIGLRMHDIRKHQPGRGWNTGSNFVGGKRKPKQTKEEEREKKREHNRKMRERYYAQGRNSRGELMPSGWEPKRGGNTGMKLAGWSKERRAKFNSTWRSKAKQRAKAEKKIQIVYPDPQDKIGEAIRNTWPEEKVTIPTVKYCPNCGEHIEGWRHS